MRFEFRPAPRPAHLLASEWVDWRWQMRHGLASADDFAHYVQLLPAETRALAHANRLFKVQATPYYTALIDPQVPNDPIRKMIVPSTQELDPSGQQIQDPLAEDRHSPVRRLVHRYPDRVLFLVTDTCSVYCRFCLRKHFTGQDEAFIPEAEYQAALNYLKANLGIREVILSGGDPLTLSDQRLFRVLKDLRSIEHIEIIRLGTRMPVVCPMRMTPDLALGLREFQPVFVMTHFNHPQELTEEAAHSLALLVDHGVPVFNQMVLLRGINNHPAIVQALSRRLLYLRVKPYYMHQCDPSVGSEHFRTSVEESLAIQRELWGRLSGLAMPNLSLDIPGGGGKVGLVPEMITSQAPEAWSFRGWDGFAGRYENPKPGSSLDSEALEPYLKEWREVADQPYGKS